MRTMLFILTACLAISMSQTAQCQIDPGTPDSIILEQGIQVPYWPGQGFATNVDIYFVTDENITGCYLPLAWDCIDDQAFISRSIWRDPFWDGMLYDTLLIPEHRLISMWFGHAENPFNSQGQRVLVHTLRLIITPEAEPQYITIDQFEPSVFGDSIDYWQPVFVPTRIIYGTPQGIDEQPALPAKISLNQNYPNPFNPQTQIQFGIPEQRFVTLEIFNILGQQVARPLAESKPAGYYSIIWNGQTDDGVAVPSGVYFYRLTADDFIQTKKMIMLK
jgi:hypothetical protein